MERAIRTIYMAGAGVIPWQEAFREIEALIPAAEISFMGYRADDLRGSQGGFAHALRFREADFERWRCILANNELPDLRAEQGYRRREVGSWFDDEEIVSTQSTAAVARFYGDVLPQVELAHALTVTCVRSRERGAGFALHRTARQGPFLAQDRRCAEELLHHLDTACALWLEGRSREGAMVAEALLRLPRTGVLLLDGRGRLDSANALAERLFLERDGLWFEAGSLRCRFPEDETALLRMIANAGDRKIDGSPLSIWVRRRGGAAPWRVRVAPLLPADAFARHRIALLIEGPSLLERAPLSALADAFGVTPAEQALLESLLRGRDLAEHARARGISVQTVKTQKRALFSRLEVHSAAELIRKAAGLGYGTGMDRDS